MFHDFVQVAPRAMPAPMIDFRNYIDRPAAIVVVPAG